MTTASRQPGWGNLPSELQARIGRATQAVHPLGVALASDCALLDTPPAQASMGWTETGGAYSMSYVRNPGARYIRVEARLAPTQTPLGAQVQLKLTVRDAAGHSVAYSDDRIPRGWKDEVQLSPFVVETSSLAEFSTPVVGYLDADALGDDLTDPSWSFDLEITLTGGAQLEGVWLSELPRFVVDDAAAVGGVIPGVFQRDAVIHDGSTDGLRRVVAVLEAARLQQRSYLSLTWRDSTTPADTPSCSSPIALEAFALLDLGSSTDAVTFGISPRSIVAGSSAGDAARFRVRYRMSGGAGTETAKVRLYGSASGSPWTTSNLAYTTSWTWSPWVACAIRTSPLSDALSFKAKVSASGPTLWLSAAHVIDDVQAF